MRSIISCSVPNRPAISASPSPEALTKFFDERKTLFRAPEFRKVDLIILSPEELAKSITVSDDDVAKGL